MDFEHGAVEAAPVGWEAYRLRIDCGPIPWASFLASWERVKPLFRGGYSLVKYMTFHFLITSDLMLPKGKLD